MEFVEPKRGDRIFHSGRITTIDSMDEDNGTFLGNGQWVCISDFVKGEDGVWVRELPPRTYKIGDSYSGSDISRKGASSSGLPSIREPRRSVSSLPPPAACAHRDASASLT